MRDITPYKGKTMNGSSTCTIPTCTPTILNKSFWGNSTSPRPSSARLTRPLLPRITSQAKVRTRMLVQNGTRISTIRARRARAEVVVIR